MNIGMPTWPFVPVSDPVDDIIETSGSYLLTKGGDRYFDAASGAAVGNIGWGRKEIGAAVARSMNERTYVLPSKCTPEREKLIEYLQRDWLPEGLDRVFFACSGSEAVDSALRLARQFHLARGDNSRYKMIGRDISYHGATLATLAVGGHDARRTGLEPLLLDSPKAPPCYCYRCPFRKTYPACKVECAHALEKIIQKEGPDTVAAFVAEPVVGSSGGAIVPVDEYWPIVREICDRYGILLIIDEVMTGFGRTGTKFAVDHWNLSPDIMILGKGISGGYAPLSAVVARAEIVRPLMEKNEQLMFYTFSAHSAACVAAIKTLDIIKNENLLQRARTMGEFLAGRMDQLRGWPNIGDVRGMGLLWAVEVVADASTKKRFPVSDNITQKILFEAQARGVLFYGGGTQTQRDLIMIAPMYISTENELSNMVRVLGEAITAATP